MQLQRNEVLTGLLVLTTVAIVTGILILLGAPGLFRPLVTYRIYLDNAAGIKLGAPVLLAGRKIGQVEKLYSPVSKEDAQRAEAAAAAQRASDPNFQPSPTPRGTATPTPFDTRPKYEARIDVRVDRDAVVYKDSKARLFTLGLLGETAVDFTQGAENSGRARDGEMFAGERVPDFAESISRLLDIIKPVAVEATATLKELETTGQNLSRITDESSQLNMALAQMRTFAENLTSMTARDSSISIAFKNIEKISTDLSSNDNIKLTLQNFRDSSDKLKAILGDLSHLGPDLQESGQNVKELTATVKTQPWRLIWPSTVKSPEPTQNPPASVNKKPMRTRRTSPTPAPRTR